MSSFSVPTMAELFAKGEKPEILFWVGCVGSFDEKTKRVTKTFAEILTQANVKFAVLGSEESCTGDPAKRAGNEFLFQIQAMTNIETLNAYEVTKIVTACPHCFNTLKNEYPALGGNYQVIHHTELLEELIKNGRLKISSQTFKGKKITYHDPCYLARGNNQYEAPRFLLEQLHADISEMKQCKTKTMCCGAGGAQMFKEAEKGSREINSVRAEQALKTQAEIITTACPFCKIMLSDGMKSVEKEKNSPVMDIVELIRTEIENTNGQS